MLDLGTLCAGAVYHPTKAAVNLLLPHRYSAIGKAAIPEKDRFVIWAFHDSIKNIWEDVNLTHRRLCFVAKSELFETRVFGFMMRKTHQIRLNRDSPNIKEFYFGLERAINENAGIVIYPEGTRNETQTVGGTGRLMQSVAGHIIDMSHKYQCKIDFLAVGREANMVDEKRTDVTVKCLTVAYALNGKLKLLDENDQWKFEQKTAESKKGGLEFLLNGVIMPTIASLSGRAYDSSHSTFSAVYASLPK